MSSQNQKTPNGMSRRHFVQHLIGASSIAIPAATLTQSLTVHADTLKKNRKSAILLWMGGGPSTMDLWDLKPKSANGGEFNPISTSGEGQICEHLPMLAKQMHNLSIVRSMSTKEADHQRGDDLKGHELGKFQIERFDNVIERRETGVRSEKWFFMPVRAKLRKFQLALGPANRAGDFEVSGIFYVTDKMAGVERI